jgi:ATP-dependent DNA helicase RecG
VIEVAIDVPNATLMVIEHAERMGPFATAASIARPCGSRHRRERMYSALSKSRLTPTARERLKIIYENGDGFEVARHDCGCRDRGSCSGRVKADAYAQVCGFERGSRLARSGARLGGASVARCSAGRGAIAPARWLGGKHELLKV